MRVYLLLLGVLLFVLSMKDRGERERAKHIWSKGKEEETNRKENPKHSELTTVERDSKMTYRNRPTAHVTWHMYNAGKLSCYVVVGKKRSCSCVSLVFSVSV